MPSAGKKADRNRARPFPLDAALEPCPKCGAKVGDRCTKRFGGRTIPTAEPHAARTETAKRIAQALDREWRP